MSESMIKAPDAKPAAPRAQPKSEPRVEPGGAAGGVPLYLRAASAFADATGGARGAATTVGPDASAGDGASRGSGQRAVVQAKLSVVPAGDPTEQQADRVADAVSSGGCCAGCASGAPCGKSAQAKREPAAAPSSGHAVSLPASSSGQPLSPSVRERVEPVLGADLGHVRVHSDSSARESARGIGARAFTHENHIYLGPRQSTDDVSLLAHEATHVVQQGYGGGEAVVQRKPADEEAAFRATSKEELDEAQENEGEDAPDDNAPKTPAEALRRAPRGKVRDAESGFKPKLDPVVAPTINRTQTSKATAEDAKGQTNKKVDEPPQPGGVGGGKGPAAADKRGAGGKNAAMRAMAAVSPQAALSKAASGEAFAAASSVPLTFDPLPEVVPPAPVMPFDAAGMPLQPHPQADDFVGNLAQRIQYMREEGQRLRERAAVQSMNALRMRGNIHVALSGVALAETGIKHSQDHQVSRHELLGQAGQLLVSAEDKADMVGTEAPGYVEQASGGHDQSQPMLDDVTNLVGQNASNTPEDEEAAGKSAEQGQKLGEANDDAKSTNDTLAQTKSRGEQLVADAAHATETNKATDKDLTGLDATLTQADDRLVDFSEQAAGARASIESLNGMPEQMMAAADMLDAEGQALVDESFVLEASLHVLQANFAADMSTVPPSSGAAPNTVVQRSPETGYDDRIDPARELKETDDQRLERERLAYERRADELKAIDDKSGGDFSRLDAGDKMLLALELTGGNLWSDIKGVNWPGFGLTLIQGFIDPRIGLAGVFYGFNMEVSGFANLFSIEAWKKDPLGNLLKSAADIVTGLAIVLGSIALLATAIAILLTAIGVAATIFTFGLGSGIWAVLGPIIAFCGDVAVTVGPLAVTCAEIALVLQALVFIKNLISAACAKTADDLSQNAEKMTTDAERGGQMLAIIVPAKVAGTGEGPEPPPPGLKTPPPPGVVPDALPSTFGLKPAMAGGPDFPGAFPEPLAFKGPTPKGPPPVIDIPGVKPPPTEVPAPIKPATPIDPTPVKPTPVDPTPVKPVPAQPGTPLIPGFPGLPKVYPHPVPGAPPPKLDPDPGPNPEDALDPEDDPEPDIGPGPGPDPEEEPNVCPPGTLPINWPSPTPWTVNGINDTGAHSGINDRPPQQVIPRVKPAPGRKASIRSAYINNPINQAALKTAAKAKKTGQIHHKWPLFVGGPDAVDNLVFLETKPVNRHSNWHQQLYRQPHGYILWDPNGTKYCVL